MGGFFQRVDELVHSWPVDPLSPASPALRAGARENFAAELARLDVALPVRQGNEYGVIEDAQGRYLFTIDADRDRPDAQVDAIATLLVLAINTCGGLDGVMLRA